MRALQQLQDTGILLCDLEMSEVSVMDECAVWCICEASVGELLCRSLRYKRMSMPSGAENCSQFENEVPGIISVFGRE